MDTLPVTEARMQAEIEALRAQYPETQDLYREVCVLLFFRYGGLLVFSAISDGTKS